MSTDITLLADGEDTHTIQVQNRFSKSEPAVGHILIVL